jgi:hypothetical protein
VASEAGFRAEGVEFSKMDLEKKALITFDPANKGLS